MTVLSDLWDDVTDFISDPPLWVGIIGAIFTAGGYGGITGILTSGASGSGPLGVAYQEIMRALPNMLRGQSFAEAWTGQWVARVKAAASIAGPQFALQNIAQPVQALVTNTRFIQDMARTYQELRSRGLDAYNMGRELLSASERKCRELGISSAACSRADARAYAINAAANQNIFNPVSWNLETGEPATGTEVWAQLQRLQTKKDYTAAELAALLREAEAIFLPPAIIGTLRAKQIEAARFEEIRRNYDPPPVGRVSQKFPTIDRAIANTKPFEPVGGAVNPDAAGPPPLTTFGKIATAVLVTSPVWGVLLARQLAKGQRATRGRGQQRATRASGQRARR